MLRPTIVVLAVLVVALAGCGTTTPARFYTLDPIARAGTAAPARLAIVIGSVSIPAAVDRPQLVVHVGQNEVQIDEFSRWAAPLADAIAGALAADLSVLLGTPDVSTAPLSGVVPTHRVTVDVQRFESWPGKEAVVEAVWAVRREGQSGMRSGRTLARETPAGPGVEALAAAHSRAISTIGTDIATAVRALR